MPSQAATALRKRRRPNLAGDSALKGTPSSGFRMSIVLPWDSPETVEGLV